MLDFRRKDPHIGGDFKGLSKSINPNGSGNVIVNKSQKDEQKTRIKPPVSRIRKV